MNPRLDVQRRRLISHLNRDRCDCGRGGSGITRSQAPSKANRRYPPGVATGVRLELSNPRNYHINGSPARHSSGEQHTQSRTEILAVFDERYTQNGNLVFAATKQLIGQFSTSMTYRVICRGKYRGPRFPRSPKVRLIGHAVTPRKHGRRIRDRIARRLARSA